MTAVETVPKQETGPGQTPVSDGAPQRAQRRPPPAAVSVFVRICLTCALLAGSLVVYALWLSVIPQARAQEDLYGQLREQLAKAEAPIGGDIEPGAPVALLEVPALGLRQVVVEGTASSQMWVGPGHRRDTKLPGSPGVSHIYGHNAAFGAPFRDIAMLRPGEIIHVTTGMGEFNYRVVGVRHSNDPLPESLPAGRSRLTLVTAEGKGWRTGWAPNEVVYVDALIDGDPQAGLPRTPTPISTAEKPMQGDPAALIPLLLWLQLLVAAAIVATWARTRWGGTQVWIVGVPVLLAGLWGVVEAMTMVLPNLS